GRHHDLARTIDAPAALNEMARGPAPRQRAEPGGQERKPRRPADLLEAESARFLEIAGQPEHVQPPDRIGEEPANHDGPRLAVGEELEPAGLPLDPTARRRTAATRDDVVALGRGNPRMLLRHPIEHAPP